MDSKGKVNDRPFYDWLILKQDNDFLYFWNLIHSISSLISSYYYIYVAAFVKIQPFDAFWITDVVFMTIFLISILVEFLTEYIPKG